MSILRLAKACSWSGLGSGVRLIKLAAVLLLLRGGFLVAPAFGDAGEFLVRRFFFR